MTVTPSSHQLRELYKATRGFVGILTGSPGTGKTTTLAALIRAIRSTPGHGELALCAPTGKAAVRLTESLSEHGLSIKAKTIHSLLQVQSAGDSDDGVGWSFHYGVREKLPHQFIFVDECSMIDCSLMRSLFAARAKGTHVLLVGDPHQLPPVGHGAPFRDLIAAGFPAGHLTEIHRNAGMIVKCCKSIRETGRFVATKIFMPDTGDNLVVLPADSPDEQVEKIIQQVRCAADCGYDPVWDVQIIVPLNDSGMVSRKSLNGILQKHLNPNGESVAGSKFRVGDKIVCGKNSRVPADDSCPPSEVDEENKSYVANGEQARVLSVAPTLTVAELDSPRRVVRIPKARDNAGDNGEDAGGGGDWDLAYAISAHKSQGSQFSVVLVVADESMGARMVCSREWWTTAVSRAEKYCVCIGKLSTIQGHCRRTGLQRRRTMLVEKIRELQMGVG